jgi:hypothetical protein
MSSVYRHSSDDGPVCGIRADPSEEHLQRPAVRLDGRPGAPRLTSRRADCRISLVVYQGAAHARRDCAGSAPRFRPPACRARRPAAPQRDSASITFGHRALPGPETSGSGWPPAIDPGEAEQASPPRPGRSAVGAPPPKISPLSSRPQCSFCPDVPLSSRCGCGGLEGSQRGDEFRYAAQSVFQ